MTKCTLPDKGITRRSIVPAGVPAAWGVPAVSIVSAAPTFADRSIRTGASSNLSGTSSTATRIGKVVTFTVSSTNTGGPATTLILIAKNVDANGNNTLQQIVATGWETDGWVNGHGAETLASAKTGSLPSGCPSVTFTVTLHNRAKSIGRRNTSTTWGCSMVRQGSDRAERPAMRSPGRPYPPRHVEQEFWWRIAEWKTPAEALDEHLRSVQQGGVATTG